MVFRVVFLNDVFENSTCGTMNISDPSLSKPKAKILGLSRSMKLVLVIADFENIDY